MRTHHFRTAGFQTSPVSWLARAGLLSGLVLMASGCPSIGTGKPWKSHFKLQEADGAKVEDPWTTQAGSEGRAGRTVEKEADPLHLRRFLMSEKAMEIERNCGCE